MERIITISLIAAKLIETGRSTY